MIEFAWSTLGFVFALIAAVTLSGRFEGDRSERSVFISIFSYTIHLHHWMYGLILLLIFIGLQHWLGTTWWVQFSKGFAFGLVFHGISYYKDYLSILK